MVHYNGRERLMAFLKHRIESELQIGLHMAIMEPFFAHAENQHYKLTSRSQCEQQHQDLTSAIQRATQGSHVAINIVTPSRPGISGFFTRNAWRRRLLMLTTHPGDAFVKECNRAWHGHEGFGEFDAIVNTALWERSLDESIDFHSRDLTTRCRNVVNSVIRLYLTYAIHGSVIGTNRLAPLMSYLPTAIPLGDIEEWPGTCLVLAA